MLTCIYIFNGATQFYLFFRRYLNFTMYQSYKICSELFFSSFFNYNSNIDHFKILDSHHINERIRNTFVLFEKTQSNLKNTHKSISLKNLKCNVINQIISSFLFLSFFFYSSNSLYQYNVGGRYNIGVCNFVSSLPFFFI